METWLAFGPLHVIASFQSIIFLNSAALTFLWPVFKDGECCKCSPSAYGGCNSCTMFQTECTLWIYGRRTDKLRTLCTWPILRWHDLKLLPSLKDLRRWTDHYSFQLRVHSIRGLSGRKCSFAGAFGKWFQLCHRIWWSATPRFLCSRFALAGFGQSGSLWCALKGYGHQLVLATPRHNNKHSSLSRQEPCCVSSISVVPLVPVWGVRRLHRCCGTPLGTAAAHSFGRSAGAARPAVEVSDLKGPQPHQRPSSPSSPSSFVSFVTSRSMSHGSTGAWRSLQPFGSS